MFKKVLVAEDLDSISFAVENVLQGLGVPEVIHAQYCDEAFVKAKKALAIEAPFDLLICDLSFKADHREEKITSGKELAAALRKENSQLKILINSIEDHPQVVRELWESGNIDGYVCKERKGMEELKTAICELAEGKTYKSPKLEAAFQGKNLHLLTDYEVKLINYIAEGLSQEEIGRKFKAANFRANSKSSIEKKLKELRENFNANTTPQLIGILKDLRLL